MNISYPDHVSIVDVSPRDGLQNESMTVPTTVKQALITDLINAGIKKLEATSFVSPKWVPQMSDNSALLEALAPSRQSDICYSVLVPNMRGFDNAIVHRPDEIVIFGSASETFSQKTSTVVSMKALSVLRPLLLRQRLKASKYVASSLVRSVVLMKARLIRAKWRM